MRPRPWTISGCRRGTGWKHSVATVPDRRRDRRLPLEEVTMTRIEPIHPGELLSEEFLQPLEISQNRLAVAIGVPPRRINEIVHGKRRVTADTALRLARYFGTTDRFWLNLQTRFDLEVEKDHLGNTLERIEPLKTAV